MTLITAETATCEDCGLTVVYVDDSYWPWHGIDGTEICHTQKAEYGGSVRWPHRVSWHESQAVFDAFEARTGDTAKHR